MNTASHDSGDVQQELQQAPPPSWLRLVVLGALGATLTWLVLTVTLPYALATTSPEWALWLNPQNPPALVEIATQKRAELLKQVTQADEPNEDVGNPSSGANEIPRDASQLSPEARQIRQEIHDLSRRAVANDPLNAKAYRLLAETVDDLSRVNALMDVAAKMSRRESYAQFWLFNRALSERDYKAALEKADILMRTRPQLIRPIATVLAPLVGDKTEGLPLIADKLLSEPSWRGGFLSSLTATDIDMRLPAQLLLEVKGRGGQVRENELTNFVQKLLQKQQADVAFYTWLQFLDPMELETLRLVYNPGFEREVSGMPFNWTIGRGTNMIGNIGSRSSAGPDNTKALRLSFTGGRVKFPNIGQTVVLPPGTYRLAGEYNVDIRAKRGLHWQVSCLYGRRQPLERSAPINGKSGGKWQRFEFTFTVPRDDNQCAAQRVELIHDARSESETFISGEAAFDDIDLERVPEVTSLPESSIPVDN